MSPEDGSTSLREEVVRGWRDELFSADTVVALVAVAVAIPAGLVASAVVGAAALYPVWFATSVGPSLGYWRGLRIEVDGGTAAKVGFAMAVAIAAVTAGVVVATSAFSAEPWLSITVGGVVGLLFGGLVSRYAFHRLVG